MQVSQTTDAADHHAKRKREHEAQLIPGVDGKKIFGFPNSIITKIRYCEYLSLTSTTGARALNVFAANGTFDPDISGVGHQPMYRDTYAAIYDQYVVIGSKITASFACKTTGLGMIVGIVADDDSTVSTVVDTLMEQNNSVHTMAGAPGSPVVTLFNNFSPLDAFGVDAIDDGSSQTAVGSNPTELFCYAVWAASADGSSTTACDVKVEIEYTVKFAELVSPTQN